MQHISYYTSIGRSSDHVHQLKSFYLGVCQLWRPLIINQYS